MKNGWFKSKINVTRQLTTYLKLVVCDVISELLRLQIRLITALCIGVMSVKYEYAAGLALVEIATLICMAYGVFHVILAMVSKQYSKLWLALQAYLVLRAFMLGVELPNFIPYSRISSASLPIVLICSALAILVPKYIIKLRRKVLFGEVLNKSYLLYNDSLVSIPSVLSDMYEDTDAHLVELIETNSIQQDYLDYVSISNVSVTNSINSDRSLHSENDRYGASSSFSVEYDFHPFGKSHKFHHKVIRLNVSA